ncbi:Pleckstrin y-like domain B member 1 [Mactra antiquata]
MISDAEQTNQRRRSAETSQNSQDSPNYRDGFEEDEFLNKVCKFELISRGKVSPPAKSPTNKGSSGKLNITSPDGRSGRRSGENFYFGEKLFTKDTATTRVSASILQPKSPKVEQNSQDINSNSLGSFGSVSSRRKSNESRNSGSSFQSRSSGKSQDSLGDRGPSSPTSIFNSPVSPVRKTELSPSAFFDTSKSIPSPSGSKPSVSPKVTVDIIKDNEKKKTNSVDENKVNGISNKTDLLCVKEDTDCPRNTFDGIDFDFNELTESQKDLTLKHREIVAERKQEQEMERLERQRLEEILNMCAEYERQIDAENNQVIKKQQEKFTVTENHTPPIPPLPLQYQHLQGNHSNYGGQSSPGPFHSHSLQHQAFGQRQVQPPKGLELETQSLDRRDLLNKTEYRSSMTNKIMTNGSLTMLSSPTNSHKEFFHGYQMRKCGSNSSNSEEESLCGSSEDTGTIKRRPNSNQALLGNDRPTSPRTTPRSPLVNSSVSKSSVQSNSVMQSNDQSHANIHYSSAFSSSNQNTPTTVVSWSQSIPTQLQSSSQAKSSSPDDFAKTFKIEPLRLTNVSVEFVDHRRFDNSEDGRHASTYSEPECDLQMKQDQCNDLQIRENMSVSPSVHHDVQAKVQYNHTAGHNDRNFSRNSPYVDKNFEIVSSNTFDATKNSSQYKNNTDYTNNTDHHDYVNINGSHYSDSNSESPSSSSASTVCPTTYHGFINNILSTGSPRSSGSMSESKSSSIENVTPINSDNEVSVTMVTKTEGSRASSSGTTDSSECSWGTVDEVDPYLQLERLKVNKTDLLKKISTLKQQIVDIETLEDEALRGLEVERALLDGEHHAEMEKLQEDQEKIQQLRQKQNLLMEKATRERQKELAIIERERLKLENLELQNGNLEKQLEQCTHDEQKCILEKLQRNKEMLDNQRKVFDDLEFQQLESEAKFEEDREQVQRRLLADQNDLLDRYKTREESLQQISSQQRETILGVKREMERLEIDRHKAVDQFKQEKVKLGEVIGRMSDLSKSLTNSHDVEKEIEECKSVDMDLHIEERDSDLARKIEEYLQSPTTRNSNAFRALESAIQNTSNISYGLPPLSPTSPQPLHGSGGNVIEHEKRRIEELRRRAADEGRAQWEEKKLREANCKSFNSLESEDSSISSSCETPSEKEISDVENSFMSIFENWF